MKRLASNLLIGVLIGLVALCVTTEVMGFAYVNNGLSQYVVESLFTGGASKVILSICTGILTGIYLYASDSDISEWKKIIVMFALATVGMIYIFILKQLEMPEEMLLNGFVYLVITWGITAVYETINKEIIKKDIKKINEKLKK